MGDLEVSERPLTVGELTRAHEEGRLVEAFGAGTACIVQVGGCELGSPWTRGGNMNASRGTRMQ